MEMLERQPTTAENVYNAIRDSICDGHLSPGERITQDYIAERLGVSRQPVVQAFLLLKAEGFVTDVGRRGLIVAPLNAIMVRDIYEIRSALDALVARLAAVRATKEQIDKAYEIVESGKSTAASGAAVTDLVKADIAFHKYIYELSGNRLTWPSVATHWQHLRRVMASVIEQSEYRGALWQEHEQILDAISKGDGDQAALLSARHVENASQALQERLDIQLNANRDKLD